MDHLLSSSGGEHILVPYVGVEEYDGSDFKAYWQRKGWRRTERGDLIFKDRTPYEKAAFFQTWLYFGCLISVFGLINVRVQTYNFVLTSSSGERFVTTRALPSLIAEWIRREGLSNSVAPDPSNSSPRTGRGYSIIEWLNWTFVYMQMFVKDAQETQNASYGTMLAIELSIMAIGESLCSAWNVIYGFPLSSIPTWGPSQILKDRLRQAGWCPSNSPFFPSSLVTSSISADYFFGSYPPPGVREHDKCSELVCSASQTKADTKNYQAVHVTATCRDCEFVKAPSDTVGIVGSNGVPIMRWHGGSLTVSARGPSTRYVAVSHVWADGLGNDVSQEENSLLRCQLSRIQGLVDRLYAEQHLVPGGVQLVRMEEQQQQQVGFWMDTLCVPIGDKYRAHRKSAIRKMGDIYEKADRVLVLDSLIQEIPRSSDIIDKFTRVHVSKWHHRLWTLQEAQLAGSLFFQFQDGAETFQDMAWPERHLDYRDVTQICSPVRLNCATKLEEFYRIFRVLTRTEEISKRMIASTRYIRSRDTTRSEDEPLCVATILNLDPGPLLTVDTMEERMERFYDLVGSFDPRIIFNDHLRLQRDGYRWAPGSFRLQLPDLITMREGGRDKLDPVTLVPNGGGLPVEFPGFELDKVGPHLGPSVFVVPRTDTVPPTQQSSTSPEPWWRQWYKLELKPDAEGRYPTWDPTLRYAVIMYTDLHPHWVPTPAILGTIETLQQGPRGADTSSTVTGMGMAWGLMESLASPRPRKWLPTHTIPQRITIRYVCGATVDMPAQEAMIDAKTRLEPYLREEIHADPTSVKWVVDQLTQGHLSQETYPIWATVYSREQKWTIR